MQSIPEDFWSWLNKLNGEDVTGVVSIVCFFAAVTVFVLCWTVCKVHKTRSDAALKRDLLDRGLSADEIATIVGAKLDKGLFHRACRP